MVKKVTKKPTNKKVQKSKVQKSKVQKNKDSNSLSIMILAIIGILLLLYFGTTNSVEVDIKVSTKTNENDVELTEESITISGNTYSSKLEAREKLRYLPQSTLTDEERSFVEGYKE